MFPIYMTIYSVIPLKSTDTHKRLLLSIASYYEYNSEMKNMKIFLRTCDVIIVYANRHEDEDRANRIFLCMVTDSIILTQMHVQTPRIKYYFVLFSERLHHGKVKSWGTLSRSTSRAFMGTYATVDVLGYCSNIDRSYFTYGNFCNLNFSPIWINHSHLSIATRTSSYCCDTWPSTFHQWLYNCGKTIEWSSTIHPSLDHNRLLHPISATYTMKDPPALNEIFLEQSRRHWVSNRCDVSQINGVWVPGNFEDQNTGPCADK